MNKNNWIFKSAQNFDRLTFEWTRDTRKAATVIIPYVQAELRRKAPVSQTKPDAGRFRQSIGWRIETLPGIVRIKFVSTAPYARYILEGTQGGSLIQPVNTLALRWKDGFGDYVFAPFVTRGSTEPNDFNVKVAEKLREKILESFASSFVTISTR